MFLMLSTPLGIIIGYIMAALCVVYLDWKDAFLIQALGLAPLAIFVLMIPPSYLHQNNKNNRADRIHVRKAGMGSTVMESLNL